MYAMSTFDVYMDIYVQVHIYARTMRRLRESIQEIASCISYSDIVDHQIESRSCGDPCKRRGSVEGSISFR